MARILVADDERSVREFLRKALELKGHDVVAVQDGAEAVTALAKGDPDFDLLLADIKMPVMDGIALALTAAKNHPDLPILLMTGYADQRERAHGLDRLIRDVIAKPFSLNEIAERVEQALDVAHG